MFLCSLCEKSFTRQDNLVRHRKNVHEKISRICPICSEEVPDRSLPTHIHKKHAGSYMCSVCNERLDSVRALLSHKHSAPNATMDEAPTAKRAKVDDPVEMCQVCKVSVKRKNLSSHLRSRIHMSNQQLTRTEVTGVNIVKTGFKCRIATYRMEPEEQYTMDIEIVLVGLLDKLKGLLEATLSQHGQIKVGFEMFAYYMLPNYSEESLKSFIIKYKVLTDSSDLDEFLENTISAIKTKSEEFQHKQSGWLITRVSHLHVNINKYCPLKGGVYIPLPKEIASKKAVINIESNDDYCFLWCIMASRYPGKINAHRISEYPHFSTELELHGLQFPMQLKQIPIFERNNNISINVYTLEYSFRLKKYQVVGPIYYASDKKKPEHVNLLLITDETDPTRQHYCLIKNLSRLVRSQLTKDEHAQYFCDGCLNYFTTQEKLDIHSAHECNHVYTTFPSTDLKKNKLGEMVPENILKFTEYEKQHDIPFVFYADFECLLEPIASCSSDPKTSYVSNIAKHVPYSFACYLKCNFDDSLSKLKVYRGMDCVHVFVRHLISETCRLYKEHYSVVQPMVPLTRDEQTEYDSATVCYLCEKPFTEENYKVRDHLHVSAGQSSNYRGAAHTLCNLNFKVPLFIPVLFHNLSNYDAHLFIKELGADSHSIDIIPENSEKYISFSKHVLVGQQHGKNVFMKLRFLDSFRFMPSSIDKLAKNLTHSQMHETTKYFPNPDDFALVCRKGVFPYNYMDSFQKLSERKLPSHERFFDSLTNTNISEAEYDFALQVFDHFKCATLGDYSDLYVKTDVLLLADIFENFRKVCKKTYKLEALQFFTSPGLTFSAMLKYTKVELELLADSEMLYFVKNSIRGGISQVSKRYARANNKFLPPAEDSPKFCYDSSKSTSYLAYWDLNNLYGYAMSTPLPKGSFKWLSEEEIMQLDVHSLDPFGSTGYFFEVDLLYPEELHDLHNDLPFCCENRTSPNCKVPKLLTTLYPKYRYVIHYRNLQQALSNGLQLSRIHRVLSFEQQAWLKDYIDLNTLCRQQATNDFEKDFYKLMNNAVFGKTMENIGKRKNIILCTHWEQLGKKYGASTYIAKPHFKSISIFDENLCAVHMGKVKLHYNKPIYVGFTVLEISKWLVYDFFYDFVKPMYGDKVSLLYSDTDSLTLEIKTDNLYDDMKNDLSRFDTSNFPPENIHGMPLVNKMKLGLMKDENGGRIMWEFVGLRSKLYMNNVEGKLTKKAKGIRKSVVNKEISDQDYKDCLLQEKIILRQQKIFRSIKHTIFTQDINKVALSPFDTKRKLIPDSVNTYAWGHKNITDEQLDIL